MLCGPGIIPQKIPWYFPHLVWIEIPSGSYVTCLTLGLNGCYFENVDVRQGMWPITNIRWGVKLYGFPWPESKSYEHYILLAKLAPIFVTVYVCLMSKKICNWQNLVC